MSPAVHQVVGPEQVPQLHHRRGTQPEAGAVSCLEGTVEIAPEDNAPRNGVEMSGHFLVESRLLRSGGWGVDVQQVNDHTPLTDRQVQQPAWYRLLDPQDLRLIANKIATPLEASVRWLM